MADMAQKKFDFLSVLTGVAVVAYGSAWGVALASGKAEFGQFTREVGPIVGMLVGYWVRGNP